jgi:hypothetical protein
MSQTLEKVTEEAHAWVREVLAYNGIRSTKHSHHTSNPGYTKSWGDYVSGEVTPVKACPW